MGIDFGPGQAQDGFDVTAMPHRTFNTEEVGRYLHLGRADMERLVKNQDIPFERHGERLVFRKVEIDAWASQRILGLEGRRLAEYHQRTSSDTRRFLAREVMMPELMQPEFIEPALPAKTKASVLRQMTALAEKGGRVWDAQGLLAGLEAREALCSTGVPGGLALLHSRFPDAYMFESPFIVLGRTVQKIPFGAPDGGATDLFFLLGCPDDRLHLHTLARLCLMAQKTNLLAQLRDAPDAASMHRSILEAEQAVLGTKPEAQGKQ
ncbi:MAG: PTS sugar transporter subunit IIA [Verrucomicrobiota bacterium]|jgi:PTS system nitrogen regulatory IIA component